MRTLSFVLLTSVVSLTACKNDPAMAMNMLTAVPPSRVYASPAVASRSTQVPLSRIPFDNVISIGTKDPVLEMDGARSFYKVVRFQARADQAVKISVESRCNCVGMNFTIPIPRVMLVSGDSVVSGSVTEPVYHRGSKGNPYLTVSLDYTPRQAGELLLLVTSDNRNTGQPASTVYTGAQRVTGISIAARADAVLTSPVGRMRVQIDF